MAKLRVFLSRFHLSLFGPSKPTVAAPVPLAGRDRRSRWGVLLLALAGAAAPLLLIVTLQRTVPREPSPSVDPPETASAVPASVTTPHTVTERRPSKQATATPRATAAGQKPTAIPPTVPLSPAAPAASPVPNAQEEEEEEEVAVPVPSTPTEDAYPGIRASFAPTLTPVAYPGP